MMRSAIPVWVKLQLLSHGFYRVSDVDAGRLARTANVKLPRDGYETRVELPDGREGWLTRTPLETVTARAYGMSESPKGRGWVWAVHGLK